MLDTFATSRILKLLVGLGSPLFVGGIGVLVGSTAVRLPTIAFF